MQRGGASATSIDLLLLLQESVLVFDETHAMLTSLAAAEPAHRETDTPACARRGKEDSPTMRRPLVTAAHALTVLVALVAAAVLIEVVDPAPLGVAAVDFTSAVRHP